MEARINLTGTTRKALVAAIEQITGEKAAYRAMPTCNYDIGEITVTKDGRILYPEGSSILTDLSAAGFIAEDGQEEIGLTISLPQEGFTDSALDNLRKLVDAKAALIKKALGAEWLDIVTEDGKVSFPWWERQPSPEETQTYMGFITALAKMAKEATRVTAKEAEVESEKYAFRCFLLRLGYIGNESKAERKILLQRLSGHAAFRNAAEEERFKANQKAKREAAKAAENAENA